MAKKITVQKGAVTKEIDARQEKDYVKNGWYVVSNSIPVYANATPYNKK